jgi:methionine aminopeptidase
MSIATEEELACMRTAGIVARLVLEAMKRAVRPGVTIAELDAIGNKVMRENGAQFHYSAVVKEELCKSFASSPVWLLTLGVASGNRRNRGEPRPFP